MERIDDILGYKELKIYQNSEYFAFSLDSIILANYCNIRLRDKNIVDFCTGNAIVPLILSQRTKANIYGVEIQETIFSLAEKSVVSNGLEKQIKIVKQDVKDFAKENISKFDLVLCNPPYFKINEKSSLNESYEKKIARHELLLNLEEMCDAVKKVLKDNGNFCLVHRTDRLMEILEVLRSNNLEPKKIKFIHEKINKEATLFLIEAQKLGKVGLKIEKPLILYDLDGKMTPEYKELQEEVKI